MHSLCVLAARNDSAELRVKVHTMYAKDNLWCTEGCGYIRPQTIKPICVSWDRITLSGFLWGSKYIVPLIFFSC